MNRFKINSPAAGLHLLKRGAYELFISRFLYSFPIQLLIYNFKKNQLILLLWGVLFAIITGSFGSVIGVPHLFLDPEYINQVNFWSFFLMGLSLGIFTMSFHIICYILDAPRFIFCGNVSKPFTRFFINNSLIPLLFFSLYIYKILDYQLSYSLYSYLSISLRILGLLLGVSLAALITFLYFVGTNKDIFKLLLARVDKSLKRAKVVRVNRLGRIHDSRAGRIRVDYYLDSFFRLKKVEENMYLNKEAVLKVFDQNHLNAVVIQFSILVFVLMMGTFRDYPYFQLPAAASFVLLFTILLMFAGAFSYWLRGWSFSVAIVILLLLNYLMGNEYLITQYEAYGLDYKAPKAEYSLKALRQFSEKELFENDRKETLIALENWKRKFEVSQPGVKPKMIFINTSGGGQRAAVWTMRTMQYVDSALEGQLMKHTMLITGASGGLLGASYFRELCLQKEYYERKMRKAFINPYDEKYLNNVSKDNLNAILFSLVVNDLFFGFQKFKYKDKSYFKDRGYAFEQQLNRNTDSLLDKSLCEYREPELLSMIPMLMIVPSILNDGRKLFISPMHISYMTVPPPDQPRFLNQKVKGIEFLRFFEKQDAPDLRFLSALRMCASFPYIMPNVKLPSLPEMETIDAGLSDNFGVSDAVRFVYNFRQWIAQNTSGIIFVSIRDTQKNKPIERSLGQSLIQRIFNPITSLYVNLEYIQDISNDAAIEYAQSWFDKKFPVHRIEFQYVPFSKSLHEIEMQKQKAKDEKPSEGIVKIERAPLSWRLTAKEIDSIKRTIYELNNQFSVRQLEHLLSF